MSLNALFYYMLNYIFLLSRQISNSTHHTFSQGKKTTERQSVWCRSGKNGKLFEIIAIEFITV